MRLICPNCDAQYEVGDDAIPDDGRDVQCSNCTHTWFERPGASVAKKRAAETETPVANDTNPVSKPDAKQRPRDLDPNVADILREEAQFEKAARSAMAAPIEMQPDLDLSQNPVGKTFKIKKSAPARKISPPTMPAPDPLPAETVEPEPPRRDLLPDIEEINSTLRPETHGSDTDANHDDLPSARTGFRLGFISVVMIALLALAAYTFAPQISAAVPQATASLDSYGAWVDGMRLWLDDQVQDFIATPAG